MYCGVSTEFASVQECDSMTDEKSLQKGDLHNSAVMLLYQVMTWEKSEYGKVEKNENMHTAENFNWAATYVFDYISIVLR